MATKKSAPATVQSVRDTFDLGDFQEIGKLSVKSWPWDDENQNERKVFKSLGPIFQSAERKGQKFAPPHVMLVKDLESGNTHQLVLGKVLYDTLSGTFHEAGSIVGHCFAVRRYKDAPDLNWYNYDVREIQDPE